MEKMIIEVNGVIAMLEVITAFGVIAFGSTNDS